MAEVFNGTPKAYAASIGVEGGTGRGRPNAAQVEAIAAFRKAGGTFSTEQDKPVKRAKRAETVTVKREARPATIVKPEPDVRVSVPDVRAWAEKKGIPVSARGRISAEVKAQYLAEVKPEDRAEAKTDNYGPTPAPVHGPETKYIVRGTDVVTTAGDGAAVCMRSGISIGWCGLHAGAHRIIHKDFKEPVDITVKV